MANFCSKRISTVTGQVSLMPQTAVVDQRKDNIFMMLMLVQLKTKELMNIQGRCLYLTSYILPLGKKKFICQPNVRGGWLWIGMTKVKIKLGSGEFYPNYPNTLGMIQTKAMIIMFDQRTTMNNNATKPFPPSKSQNYLYIKLSRP